MCREQNRDVRMLKLVERVHALTRGDYRVTWADHLTPEELDLCLECPALMQKAAEGDAWFVRADAHHFTIYAIEPLGAPRHAAIRCKHCGAVSHNAGDVLHLYCPKCKVFHQNRDWAVRVAAGVPLPMTPRLPDPDERGKRPRNIIREKFEDLCALAAMGGPAAAIAAKELKEAYGMRAMLRPEGPNTHAAGSMGVCGTIEALLVKHPQMIDIGPFAHQVAAAARTLEPMR